MEYRTLIANGTVVDGSGAPAYAADVRIRGGRIDEIGRILPRRAMSVSSTPATAM